MYGGGYGGGYPPQPPMGGGYGGGYPQQPGYPPQGGFPPQGGYPPAGGMPGFPGAAPAGYGGSMGGMPGMPGMGGMGPPGTGMQGMQPPANFANNWYATYYNQMQQAEMADARQWFQSVDTDRSGSITANEIAQITFGGFPLGLETAYRLVRVFDRDRSGTMDFFEYATLHKFMKSLQTAFFAADRDHSGHLDVRELPAALNAAGLQLAPNAVMALARKYAAMPVGFAEFLQLASTVAQCKSLFEWRDVNRTGKLTVDFNTLLELVGEMS